MPCYSGKIWDGSCFYDGYVVVEGARVSEVGEGSPAGSVRVGFILPGLTDGHTHLGDAGLHLDRKYGLEELVAPPDGLKHRYLRDTPSDVSEANMSDYAGRLAGSGVSRFLDFREGGLEGVRMLRRASDRAVILGRPLSKEFDPNEVDAILDEADGIGISSISDVPDSYVSALADAVHRRGKHLAIHVSERIREDIGRILSLEPDLIVHMCEATDADLRACADVDLPVVVCPTSNLYFGKVPPIRRMYDAGIRVSIGTD
ncbi:MAG: amidohydrolase family protein, partial [Candidatus Methanomethylophilaceae archaeon]|nr:amidohydrolase family protein [Candidatus Methanomethylophilaceae archaeon]